MAAKDPHAPGLTRGLQAKPTKRSRVEPGTRDAPKRKFGPSRGEHKLRLGISLAGLAFLGVALAIHGIPSGPAFFELFIFGGSFFVGSAIWSARKLILHDHPTPREDAQSGG